MMRFIKPDYARMAALIDSAFAYGVDEYIDRKHFGFLEKLITTWLCRIGFMKCRVSYDEKRASVVVYLQGETSDEKNYIYIDDDYRIEICLFDKDAKRESMTLLQRLSDKLRLNMQFDIDSENVTITFSTNNT